MNLYLNSMRKNFLFVFLLLLTAVSCDSHIDRELARTTKNVMETARKQMIAMAGTLKEGECPRSYENGKLVTSNIYWWCSGFYPGSMWYVYEYTASDEILSLARKYTEILEPLKDVTTDHDIGFQLFCSYGNGFRLTGDEKYLEVLRQGAHSLASRFNSVVGSIRSWDFKRHLWDFPVIIDNMMNLELIAWVAGQDNDDKLRDIAIKHADTAMQNHFREDFSTWHLVDYNPATGEIRGKQTVQGYSDDSRWARGQSWALYGFTMMYRMTGKTEYLDRAEKVASLLIPLLPEDGIPYWDYDSPKIPDDVRDASSAAIMASALVELSDYLPSRKDEFLAVARKQIMTLASPEYLAEPGTNGNFLLKHSVGNVNANSEVDVPLTYADYYFLEALVRFEKKNRK